MRLEYISFTSSRLVGSTALLSGKEPEMAQKRVMVEASLMVLWHDLTPEERILLTELGNRTALKEFLATRRSQQNQVAECSLDITGESALALASGLSEEVNLAPKTLAELGFKKGASSLREICERAKHLELKLCPAGVGVNHFDQLNVTAIWVVKPPFALFCSNDDGDLRLYRVYRDDLGHWSGSIKPWDFMPLHWGAGEVFLFCR